MYIRFTPQTKNRWAAHKGEELIAVIHEYANERRTMEPRANREMSTEEIDNLSAFMHGLRFVRADGLGS
jgi:hypothetical protein